MFRIKLSNFIKNNIDKIKDVGRKLMIVAIVVFIATIMLSINRKKNIFEMENTTDIYVPTKTIIKGKDITEEQYTRDLNVVSKFLELCNRGEVEEAYSLISKECKEEAYPTVEYFRKYYYDIVFDKKREYNLQSWISTLKYTVYKIRYTNTLLSTGTFNEDDVYEDYIVLNKKAEKEQISIGEFVSSENFNTITKKNDIETRVIKKNLYVNEVQYKIEIKNNTNKTILLDTLEGLNGIKLLGNGVEYNLDRNKVNITNLIIESGETKLITLTFNKRLTSNNLSKQIFFPRIIKDYDIYKQNKKEYDDIIEFKIKLEE